MPLVRSLQLSLLLLPLAAGMASLGLWQLQRMEQKQALLTAFEQAPTLELNAAVNEAPRYSRVTVEGSFDMTRHILLDNMIFQGKSGVHVLTPFTSDTGVTILANRGWLPLPPDRSRFPDFATPDTTVRISATLAPPPEHRQRLGKPDVLDPDQWPQLVTYLDIASVSEVLGRELPQRVLWLDADDPAGFQGRDWSPATMSPERHRAYAVQWFGLAAAAIVIWLVLILRSGKITQGAKRA